MALTKKQSEVLDFIRSYIGANGYSPTQREIKEHFQLKSFGSVQRYIKYLTDGGYLHNDENARRGLSLFGEETQGRSDGIAPLVQVPILGKVAAGVPIEAIESSSDYTAVPASMCREGHRYFALTVEGDSMWEDGILEGDTAVCRLQNNAYQGQTVVAVLDGNATLKRFYKYPNRVELHPANSTMSPFVIDNKEQNDLRIVGVLVGVIRTY